MQKSATAKRLRSIWPYEDSISPYEDTISPYEDWEDSTMSAIDTSWLDTSIVAQRGLKRGVGAGAETDEREAIGHAGGLEAVPLFQLDDTGLR